MVSEETTKKLLPMLEQVVSERGTAQDVAAIKGYVAGKTGTAQLYDPPKAMVGRVAMLVTSPFIGMAPGGIRLVVAVITGKAWHFRRSQTGEIQSSRS